MSPAPGSPADAEVIRAVLAGDTDRFALLLERYRSGVFRIVTRHVPRERVEETAHEVFVRAFRSLGSYGGETPFGHWLSRIAVNACCDFWREHYANREEPLSALSEDGERALEALAAGRALRPPGSCPGAAVPGEDGILEISGYV